MANRGFFCLDGYLKRTERLTDEEMGKLFRACMIYHATGVITELEGRESVAFDFIREDIDAASEAYNAKCEINKRNRNSANGIERPSQSADCKNETPRLSLGEASICDSELTSNTVSESHRPDTSSIEKQRSMTNVDETERPTTDEHESRNINENENTNTKEKNKEREPSRAHAHEEAEKSAERFGRFWAAYPRHEGKKKAEEAFRKVCTDDAKLETMLAALAKWKKSDQWSEDGGRFIPHPATWLDGRRWEDEVPHFRHDQRPPKMVTAQIYEQRDYSDAEETEDALVERLMRSMGMTVPSSP